MGAAMLYLAGGAALGVWCFELNAVPDEPVQVDTPPPTHPEPASDPGPTPVQPVLQPAVHLPPGIDIQKQRKINEAIVKGVWYLKDRAGANGAWGKDFIDRPDVTVGFAALPGLTLLECGVYPSDPVVQKAAAVVRTQVFNINPEENYAGSSTYQMSLAILFLDRLGDKKDESLIQYLALCLIAGQHPTDGAWTYGVPALDRALVPQLLKQLADPRQSLDDWRRAALKGDSFAVPQWDNSNTQFAILGLLSIGT
jgi:hypothetical protein